MTGKQKILIDTDIGDDIDDAIALYVAMRRQFEIVGITTVFRNTVDRARQVKKLLREYGNGYESVPVYAGCGVPMGTEPQEYPHIPHYTPDLAEDVYTPDGADADAAVDFILDSCRRYGKELTVIAIGPFTNIARAIQKDKDALNLAGRVVIMGGAFYKQYADWNVISDVTAADIMFRNLHNLACIGADVTHLLVAEQALYDDLLTYAGKERGHVYLTELFQLWRKDRPRAQLLLHDPLVMYYADDPGICDMRSASVVVLTDGYARGMTLNVDAYGKKRFNPEAYTDFDGTQKTLVAAAVKRDVFNARIFADIVTLAQSNNA